MLPKVDFCGLQISRLIVGANPFGGYSHQSKSRDAEMIAFHTIENRAEDLPDNIRAALGPWVAGCDICQDVCPWNQGPLPSS